MEGYILQATNDDGSVIGYFNGTDFNNRDLNKANFIPDKAQARAAMGNLQRTNTDIEITAVKATMTIALQSQATGMV